MADEATAQLKDEDRWILAKVNEAAQSVTDFLDKFELGMAGQKVYETIWDEYCDWYIEIVKRRLYGEDEEDKKTARYVLQKALKDLIKLLHPFMPFITEEIWGFLPHTGDQTGADAMLIRASWPTYDESLEYPECVSRIETAIETIKAVRNIRVEAEAAPSRKLSMIVRTDTLGDTISRTADIIKNIANVTEIAIEGTDGAAPKDVMSAVIDGAEILIPLEDLVDFEAELERLQKEKVRLEGEVLRVEKKLSNKGFVEKAPAAVVEQEREKRAKYNEMLATVVARLESMGAKGDK